MDGLDIGCSELISKNNICSFLSFLCRPCIKNICFFLTLWKIACVDKNLLQDSSSYSFGKPLLYIFFLCLAAL